MKSKLRYLYSTSAVIATLIVFRASRVFAGENNDLDQIGGYDAVTGSSGTSSGGGTIPSGEPSTVGGFFKGYNPVTADDMKNGQYYAAPFVSFFGTIVGFTMAIVVAWMAVQTAVDLLYWAIPPLRGILAKQNPTAGNGGMGGMGMGGMQQRQSSSKLPIFVSDDMLQAMAEGGNVSSQGGINGGMGMGGFGGGMVGFGGGMGMNMSMQQQESKPHILTAYFKKRLLSLVIFGVCIAVLFSSALMDTGINLGAFLIKLINFFNTIVVSHT